MGSVFSDRLFRADISPRDQTFPLSIPIGKKKEGQRRLRKGGIRGKAIAKGNSGRGNSGSCSMFFFLVGLGKDEGKAGLYMRRALRREKKTSSFALCPFLFFFLFPFFLSINQCPTWRVEGPTLDVQPFPANCVLFFLYFSVPPSLPSSQSLAPAETVTDETQVQTQQLNSARRGGAGAGVHNPQVQALHRPFHFPFSIFSVCLIRRRRRMPAENDLDLPFLDRAPLLWDWANFETRVGGSHSLAPAILGDRSGRKLFTVPYSYFVLCTVTVRC